MKSLCVAPHTLFSSLYPRECPLPEHGAQHPYTVFIILLPIHYSRNQSNVSISSPTKLYVTHSHPLFSTFLWLKF